MLPSSFFFFFSAFRSVVEASRFIRDKLCTLLSIDFFFIAMDFFRFFWIACRV